MENNIHQKPKSKWFLNQLMDLIQKVGAKKLKLNYRTYVFLISLSHYSDKKGYSFPTAKQIENQTMIPENHQCICIKELQKLNILEVVRKYDRRTKMTRRYFTVHLEAIIKLVMDEDGTVISTTIETKNDSSNTERVPVSGSDQVPVSGSCSPYIYKHTQKEQLPSSLRAYVQTGLDEQSKTNVVKMSEDYYFEQFWEAYPRKEQHKKALAAWKKGKLDRHAVTIIADVKLRQARHIPWIEAIANDEKNFLPLPTSYLNGERWHDEIIDQGAVKNERTETRVASGRESQRAKGVREDFERYEERRRDRRNRLSSVD